MVQVKKKARPNIEEEIETVVIEVSDDTKEPEIENVNKVEKKEKEDKSEQSSDVREKEEEEKEPFSKEELEDKDSNKPSFLKTIFWMIFPVILLILAVAAGIFIYNLGVKKGMQEAVATITPTPEETTATPTPKTTLKRGDLKIQVLNGAGVGGTASKAKKFLEELGYEDIDTGNADSFDFKEAKIAIKEGKDNVGEFLKDDLSSDYSVSKDFTTLDEESKYDVVVTIGSKAAE